MAQAQKTLTKTAETPSIRHGKHRLDQMQPAFARHLVMFRPSEIIVKEMLSRARREIPGLAPTEQVLRVFRYNPDYIMALTRKSKFNLDCPAGEGFVAMLALNKLGLQHLALGTFDASKPDERLLAKPNERPAGVYLWCVYAPGSLVAGMALFMQRMNTEQYRGVDVYSRPNTDAGIRFNQAMGFTTGCRVGDIDAPHVWKFSRATERPAFDTYVPHPGSKEIGITVARTFEDLMKVAAIRNAVYIGEQECPYDEEYDGNDLSSTHILAYIGDEPVGCLRVRFFADFAKFERMAIRKEFRKSRAAILLAQAAIKLACKKGYRRGYAHSQARLVGFWSRFGFRPLEGAKPFVFSDYDYVEIIADFPADPDAIRIGTSPYVLIRPEGRWDEPGILETSAERPATNPSVAKKG